MLTKRQRLQFIGSAAGVACVYRTMAALGMLGVSGLTGCLYPSVVFKSTGDRKRIVILRRALPSWWLPMSWTKWAMTAQFWTPPRLPGDAA